MDVSCVNIFAYFLGNANENLKKTNLNYFEVFFIHQPNVYTSETNIALWWELLIFCWQLFSEKDRNQIEFRQWEIESLFYQQESQGL